MTNARHIVLTGDISEDELENVYNALIASPLVRTLDMAFSDGQVSLYLEYEG